MKKFILASLISGLVMWTIAGIWHNLVQSKFYSESLEADHEGILILLLAYILLGGFMSYLYSKFIKSENYWFEGVKFGMIIGLLWVFPHELAMAGAHSEPLGYVFRNAIWHMLEQAFGGVIIALIYKHM